MTINELDRRITFRQYVFGQDAFGGNIKALANSFEVWAKVEQNSNSRGLENLQVTYNEAYRVTTRYEGSRTIKSNDEIVYESDILSIHGIREESEGKKRFNIISCYSTGSTISSNVGTVYNVAQVINYTATGGETEITDEDMVGYTIILVFRDGWQYTVIDSGVPVGKQVLFDSVAGTLEFPVLPALQPTEQVDIYLLN